MKKRFGSIVFILLISLFGCGTKEQVEDQAGSSSSTVKIGTQVWMRENLNVDHYRNGDTIPQVQNKDEMPCKKSQFRTAADKDEAEEVRNIIVSSRPNPESLYWLMN